MIQPKIDPFQPLDGISSTSYLGEYVDPEFSTSGPTGTSGTSGTSSGGAISTNTIVAQQTTSSTPTTATATSNPTTTLPNLGIGLGMGSGSSSGTSENNVASGVKKETLLDKWEKLSDLKKGLIILAIAAGSYYGYKQLK